MSDIRLGIFPLKFSTDYQYYVFESFKKDFILSIYITHILYRTYFAKTFRLICHNNSEPYNVIPSSYPDRKLTSIFDYNIQRDEGYMNVDIPRCVQV